jgi:hypothetical protein
MEKISIIDDDQENAVITDFNEYVMSTDELASMEDQRFVQNTGSLNDLSSREIESTVNFANLVERTGEQSCSHLTKNERALLDSCVGDAAFQRREGDIKWDEIAGKFSEMADDVTIFCRSRKKLRSSSKSFKEVSKKRMKLSTPGIESSTPPPIFTSEPTDEPLLSSSSSVVQQNP